MATDNTVQASALIARAKHTHSFASSPAAPVGTVGTAGAGNARGGKHRAAEGCLTFFAMRALKSAAQACAVRPRLRTRLATLACVTGLSLVTPMAPAVAQDKNVSIEQLVADAAAGKADLAALAGVLADIEGNISSIEAEIGRYREEVNRALVDLQDARTEAAQARRGTETAHQELEAANAAVAEAQAVLDEISRTAYRRSGASDSITAVAGGDARATQLERQTFLRGQADKQRSVVERLEQERADAANKESRLRAAQELADARVQRAEDAETSARTLLEERESKISTATQEREKLVKQEQQAQQALQVARGGAGGAGGAVVSPVQGGASGEARTAGTAQTEANATSKEVIVKSEPAEAGTQDMAGEESETQGATATTTTATTTGATNTGTTDAVAVEALAAGSSQIDPQLVEQAATIIGSSQPALGDIAGGSSDADTLYALQGLLTVAAEAMTSDSTTAASASTTTGTTSGSEDADLLSQVAGLLEELPTTGSVTSEASAIVGDSSRSAKIETVIARAESQIGVPYAWGGGDASGPTQGIRDGGVADSFGDYAKRGFDCSGLTLYSFAGAGISLPHYTGYQYNQGTKVDPQSMKRGDLIFYGPDGGQHVAIYLGDGMMIEAPQSGQTVTKTPVRWSGMAPYAVRLI